MKVRSLFSLIITISCLLILASCKDTEEEEVKFKVIAYGGGFSGTYIVDSGNDVDFEGETTANSIYRYEQTVEVDDQLEIVSSPLDATGDGAPSSLEIKVYRDDSLIKSEIDSDDNIGAIRLTYTSGEAAETTE